MNPRRGGMRSAALISVLPTCALLLGCEDPPPPPDAGAFILGIRTVLPEEPNPMLSGGMREGLEGLTTLRATVTRIDVVHRTVVDDPASERVITIDDTERTFELIGDLQAQAPRVLGHFSVPVGFVVQLRLVVTSANITLRGGDHLVAIPSGEHTGIKIVPIDDVPFEIRANERTAGRIVFNPFEQLIRNRGVGFIHKPVLEAEHVSLLEISNGILLDEVVVRFNDGTPQVQIDDAVAATGAAVLGRWIPTSYYRLRIPASMPLVDALEFYNGLSTVAYVLPNSIAVFHQDDPEFAAQTQWADVGLDVVYAAGATGSHEPVVAVVDSGVNYDHHDLIDNIWININELPPTWTDDVLPLDGFMDADFDHDGLITFVDLNMLMLTPTQRLLLAAFGLVPRNLDSDPLITPTNLIDAVEDGFDDDDFDGDLATFVDDIIGWDFSGDGVGDNRPLPDLALGPDHGHGTWMAGTLGAVGNNMTDVAGVSWQVRIMPLRVNVVEPFGAPGEEETGLLRDSAYRAARYAAAQNANVVNLSLGAYVTREGNGTCGGPSTGVYELDEEKFDAFVSRLNAESADLVAGLGSALLVVAAGSCLGGRNMDRPGVYGWPGVAGVPNAIMVANVQYPQLLGPGPGMTPHLAFGDVGPATIQIGAPGAPGFTSLDAAAAETGTLTTCQGGPGSCRGGSFSAAMVSGTAALLISHDSTLLGQPCRVADRILRNADNIDGLRDEIANGAVLNVERLINDVVTIPVRTCP